MTENNTQPKTLRDEFAIAALPIAWAAYHEGYTLKLEPERITRYLAQHSYSLADAMLAAREGGAQ